PLTMPLRAACLAATPPDRSQTRCRADPQQCVELSMMDDAFDDQYMGCAEEMDEIAPGLLGNETSKSSVFSTVWEKSKLKWERVKKEISLAIIAYTDNGFHSQLNAAVREAGTSRAHYMASFQFKAFHYYLTRALQLLRGRCDVMYNMTVYRGVFVSFQHTGSGHSRFGYFASSSFDIGVAKKFGMATLFTIHTCFGIEIRNFSHFQEEEEVLIPVHEIFSVARGQEGNSFVLRSTNRACSHFNCAYLGGESWAEQEKYLCGALQGELRRGTLTWGLATRIWSPHLKKDILEVEKVQKND
uniref:NAD(P)(+)--arginine ADP-ribosyltransferase n=1 Tax=Chelydra serpentina TaxID=8475 RepID=A0A8C3SFP7_CHESE